LSHSTNKTLQLNLPTVVCLYWGLNSGPPPASIVMVIFFFLGGVVLRFELKASHLLGRHTTTWATLPGCCGGIVTESIGLCTSFCKFSKVGSPENSTSGQDQHFLGYTEVYLLLHTQSNEFCRPGLQQLLPSLTFGGPCPNQFSCLTV
jgi:hypothetical protein